MQVWIILLRAMGVISELLGISVIRAVSPLTPAATDGLKLIERGESGFKPFRMTAFVSTFTGTL